MKPKIIDFFCGAGGLSHGFYEAGYEVVLGIDNNEHALETYRHNHKGSKALNINLLEEDYIQIIKDNINNKTIDVIIGGPPCQGFSLTGARKKDDVRNRLYHTMFEAAKVFKPKAIVLENVPGMLTLYNGGFKNRVIEEFESLEDYNFDFKVLYGPDYGIPQIRKRVFFIGIHKDYGEVKFPEPTHTPENYVTCEQAISDLPSLENEMGKCPTNYIINNNLSNYQKLMRKNSNILYNHIGTNHTDHVKWVISQVPEGGNHKDLPEGVGDSRNFNEAWTRYHSQKQSKTIDTGHRNHFHYKWNRVPTVRENARLQSFPDTFEFLGNKTQQYRQAGNAVPPLFSYNLGKTIKEILKRGKK